MSAPQPREPRVLEFFSGVGGNSLGLRLALLSESRHVAAHVVASVEICAHAQLTHAANVNAGPPTAILGPSDGAAAVPLAEPRAACSNLNKGIETLSPKALDKFGADVWLMSPPCQPFTRQGKQSQGADARCAALAHITHVLLPQVKRTPRLVYVENVQGFEGSAARDSLVTALQSVGLTRIVEHLWNPAGHLAASLQAKDASAATEPLTTWPNSRLRYYMVATAGSVTTRTVAQDEAPPVPAFAASPVRPLTPAGLVRHLPGLQRTSADGSVCVGDVIGAWLEAASAIPWRVPVDAAVPADLLIPARVLCKTGRLFDIVRMSANRTNCFTKNYGRKVEGAGSILVPDEQAARLEGAFAAHDPAVCAAAGSGEGDVCRCTLRSLGLRYFDPYEVAALLGFPPDFRFPPSLTQRQRWALMGNSVNPLAVSQVLQPFVAVMAPTA